jgi:tetratricopeptide (TPR) repeat protein
LLLATPLLTGAEQSKSSKHVRPPRQQTTVAMKVTLPPRDDAKLQLVRETPLSASDIPLVAERIVGVLRSDLEPVDLADAKGMMDRYAGNSDQLANAAAIAWVEKSTGAALLLAAEAVRARPTNLNAINTLGALLANGGFEAQGIPLLQYLTANYPDLALPWNNLGQAWFRIGEVEKAKAELARCLALAPATGSALASTGLIEAAEGNTEAATAHLQAAVAANFSPTAQRYLSHQRTKFSIPPSLRNLIQPKEYFNPTAFKPPEPQSEGAQYDAKVQERKAFMDFIDNKSKEIRAAIAQYKAAYPDYAAQNTQFHLTQSKMMKHFIHLIGVLHYQLDDESGVRYHAKMAIYNAAITSLKQTRDTKFQEIGVESDRIIDQQHDPVQQSAAWEIGRAHV